MLHNKHNEQDLVIVFHLMFVNESLRQMMDKLENKFLIVINFRDYYLLLQLVQLLQTLRSSINLMDWNCFHGWLYISIYTHMYIYNAFLIY